MEAVHDKFFELTALHGAEPVAVSEDSQLLAFVRTEGPTQFVVVKASESPSPMCQVAVQGLVQNLAFSDDGLLLVGIVWQHSGWAQTSLFEVTPVQTQRAVVKVWSSLTGEELHSFDHQHAAPSESMQTHSLLAAISTDQTKLYTVAIPQAPSLLPSGAVGDHGQIQFSVYFLTSRSQIEVADPARKGDR